MSALDRARAFLAAAGSPHDHTGVDGSLDADIVAVPRGVPFGPRTTFSASENLREHAPEKRKDGDERMRSNRGKGSSESASASASSESDFSEAEDEGKPVITLDIALGVLAADAGESEGEAIVIPPHADEGMVHIYERQTVGRASGGSARNESAEALSSHLLAGSFAPAHLEPVRDVYSSRVSPLTETKGSGTFTPSQAQHNQQAQHQHSSQQEVLVRSPNEPLLVPASAGPTTGSTDPERASRRPLIEEIT